MKPPLPERAGGEEGTLRPTLTRKSRQRRTPKPAPPTPNGSSLLSVCITDYLAHVRANFSRRTYGIDALSLKHFAAFAGDVPIGTINTHTIDRYKVHRTGLVRTATVNLELRVIKAFFNCLRRWDLITTSPCSSVRQIREAESPPAFLSEQELAHLLDRLGDHWLRPIVLFAAMTGARIGEILNLTWAEVDLPRRLVCIHSSSSYRVKGGKIRTIPLNHTVVDLLSGMNDRTGLVFKGVRGGHANANHVSAVFRRFVRLAGVDRRIHFHSLRHGFASALVQKGVSLYQVQKLLGHSSPRVTEMYSHLQSTQMHEVVEILALDPPMSPQTAGTAKT